METPKLTTMAKTLAIETVKPIAAGCKNRPQDDIERIQKVCELCEQVFYDGLAMRCRKCGCNMSIKTKWTTTRCPVGKW